MRRFTAAIVLLAAAAGRLSYAQRPSNSSICDYYAQVKYGSNSSSTQFQLMQSIVALAFGGGGGLSNASNASTGILNPGVYQNTPVDLRPWFDGSEATTNLNNQPVGINWLDNGDKDPLIAYLNGSTSSVVLDTSSNEYRLFTHFFGAFGSIFGCSLVGQFPKVNSTSSSSSSGPISLAYVHKFMNLNQTDLGYFIDQLTTASVYYGFSEADATTLNTFMNARYNVACAPPVNGQLYSLCQATECPLAEPSPDCADYQNLGPGGVAGNSTASATQTAGPSVITQTVSASGASSAASTTAAAATSSSSAPLSTGGIAGVAIGGAAALFLGALVLFFLFRRRKEQPPPANPQQPQMTGSTFSGAGGHSPGPHDAYYAPGGMPSPGSHASFSGATVSPHASTYNSYGGSLYVPGGKPTLHEERAELSETGSAPPPAEMDASGNPGSTGWGYHAPSSPQAGSPVQQQQQQQPPSVRVSAASPVPSSPRRSPLGFSDPQERR